MKKEQITGDDKLTEGEAVIFWIFIIAAIFGISLLIWSLL
jgi:hypothetical protein